MKSLWLATAASCLLAFSAPAVTHFVDINSTNPVPPYTDWSTAATNIQDAIDAAGISDTVLVTNGIYQYGGDSFNGSNRVDVASSVTVQSVNGPSVTIIQGYQVPGTTNGASAVRCAYVREFGNLIGFTLTNGATTAAIGDYGGGVMTETSCTVSNCIIIGNAGYGYGGGAYIAPGSFLNKCIVAGNRAFGFGQGGGASGPGALVDCVVSNNVGSYGGGVGGCVVYSSLLVGNSGGSGGAAYISKLNNCTVTANVGASLGAADGCTLNNCIIYYNFTDFYADCYQCNLTNCCTTIGPGTSTLPANCISNAPGFVNPRGGDYHLNPWSRCIDAGNSAQATNSLDLDGNPRIAGAAVDMGAYESQSPFQITAHYVSLLSTNPVPPYTNWSTAATNIQDAVGVAQPGEFVIAGDGVYARGSTGVLGTESNRVALTNGIILASAGGPQAAIISGGTQMRCVFVGTNSTLMGFTLTNGHASASGDITNGLSGGGAWCAAGAVVSNCVCVANIADPSVGLGGGIFGGTIWNCVLMNNSGAKGGAAAAANLYNCSIISNGWAFTAIDGGGLYGAEASNCTIIDNRAYSAGGGVYQSTLFNCAMITNSTTFGGGGADSSTLHNCTLSGNHGPKGGAYLCTNYNCVLSGNSGSDGGGANGGISYNCIFSGNSSGNGGGALSGTFYNCLFTGNKAGGGGGGVQDGSLYNCTVVGNTVTNGPGGGVYGSTAYNSIIYYNISSNSAAGSNYNAATLIYCCTAPLPITANGGCFTNEPLLVNWAGADFHLQSNSPCINSGNNVYLTNNTAPATDLGGNPRIVSTAVDVGAYEFQSPASLLPYSWLYLYGLPTDGSADYADVDGDGLSNYAEWRAGTNPTNAASVLAIQSPIVTDTNATITWQSVFGKNYYVQSTPDLFTQPFQSIASNIVGAAGTTTSYTDTNAVGGVTLFYRVGVQ